ncbi:MAG TPA: histidine kinase dimerization/phosphoacceptor domain -containing protein, partial [Dissulfurispiraceae bacterium]|nr:histidine kinase dimerization/phosphoacceptor domain -containing protein [Dissulfurispiraceae bacterium]
MIGVLVFYGISERITENEKEDLSTIAKFKAAQTERWLAERRANVEVYAKSRIFAAALDKWRSGDRSVMPYIRDRLAVTRTAYGYLSTEVIMPDGRLVARDGAIVHTVSQLRNLAQLATAQTDPVLIDLHRDDGTGAVQLEYAISIWSERSSGVEAVGVAIFTVDAGNYLFPMLKSWPLPSRSGEVVLMRREGDDLLILNELRTTDEEPMTIRRPQSDNRLPAAQALQQGGGAYEGYDYREVPVLSAQRAISGTPWILGAKIDRDEAFEDLRRQGLVTAILALMFIGAAAAVSGVFWQRNQRSHYQALFEAEAASRAMENKYRLIAENSGDVVWIYDVGEDRFPFISPSIMRLRGFSAEEAMAQGLKESLSEASYAFVRRELPERIAALARGVDSVRTMSSEIDQPRKDGTLVPMEVVTTLVQDSQGRVVKVIGVSRDISERRAAERALRESETLLRQAQGVARMGHYVFDVLSGYWTCSDVLDELLGIDANYPKNVEGWLRLIHPDDRERMGAYLRDHVIAGRQVFDQEYRIMSGAGGAVRWLHGMGRLECSAEGTPLRMVGIIQDITERKDAENVLKQSLEEKTSLLKEVHHRVKNNLQIVDSLLSLQSSHTKDVHAIGSLRDSRDRVRSMALLHEMLYRSQNVARIDFGSYVPDLCKHLFVSYGMTKSRVALKNRV